jgi:hypothetical protein
MAAQLSFLQSPVLTQFIYPFLLIFFIIFAVLEKTKIFGEGKTQINALIAFVIGFIFVSAIFPKEMVNNLILFLTIAIVIMFVVLMLWGFVFAGEKGLDVSGAPKGLKWAIGIFIVIVVAVAVLWAAGINISHFFDDLFNASWSSTFWTDFVFVIVIAAGLAVALSSGKK